jgi:hypothetical protein
MLKNSGAAGFSKDSLSELFNFLEKTVDLTINGIIIYEYKVDDCALTIF